MHDVIGKSLIINVRHFRIKDEGVIPIYALTIQIPFN